MHFVPILQMSYKILYIIHKDISEAKGIAIIHKDISEGKWFSAIGNGFSFHQLYFFS